ncbi:MAG: hypothetical protein ABI658_24730 [Acidimicrobiales bacterium]
MMAATALALVIGMVGIAFAVCDARVGALFGLSAAAVIGYGIFCRGGAEMHDYWNYAALVPLAVAASAGFDHLARALLEADAFAIEGPYGLVPASVANRARS